MPPVAHIPGTSDEVGRKVADVCRRHHVRVLRVFGSVANNTADQLSDVDVLVEFELNLSPDLFELGGLQQDLTDAIGREVDLKTPDMFSQANLSRVISRSVLGYAA